MGRLEVRICGARHIGDIQKVGIPDPYVKIIMGDNKKTQIQYKTKVVNNTLNPEWNEVSKFQIADYNSAQVVFELWNDNVMVDDLMGSYRLSVNGLTRGVVHDIWVILTGARLSSAEIHLQVLAVDFGADPQPGSRVVSSIEEYIAASTATAPTPASTPAGALQNQSSAADYDPAKKPTASSEPAVGIPLQAQAVPTSVAAPPQPQPAYAQQPQYYQPQYYPAQPQVVYAQQAPPPPPQVVYYQQAPPPPQPGYYAAPPPHPGYYGAPPPPQQYSYGPPRL